MRTAIATLGLLLAANAHAVGAPVRLESHTLESGHVTLTFKGAPGTYFCAAYVGINASVTSRLVAGTRPYQDDLQLCAVTDEQGRTVDRISVTGSGILLVNVVDTEKKATVTVVPIPAAKPKPVTW